LLFARRLPGNGIPLSSRRRCLHREEQHSRVPSSAWPRAPRPSNGTRPGCSSSRSFSSGSAGSSAERSWAAGARRVPVTGRCWRTSRTSFRGPKGVGPASPDQRAQEGTSPCSDAIFPQAAGMVPWVFVFGAPSPDVVRSGRAGSLCKLARPGRYTQRPCPRARHAVQTDFFQQGIH